MIRQYPIHAILLLVLLGGWILLSTFNVLVDDDLVFLRLLQEKGFVDAARYQYDTWNTRWMSFLWLHVWMQFWAPTSSLLPYHLFTLVALIWSSFRCIRALQKWNWIRDGSTTDTLFMAALFAFAVVVGTYHIGDTWFWVNTSTMYGWNLIFIVWATSIVVMPYKSGVIRSMTLVFCGLYTGGASEPAVATVLLLTSAFLFKYDLPNLQRNSILTFLAAMCVAFLIAYLGHGHVKREEALPDVGIWRWAGLSAWYSFRIAVVESPLRVLIIFTLLWPLRGHIPDSFKHSSFRTPLAVWLTTVGIHTTLIVAVMGDYGPPRALSFIGLVSVGTVMWLLITRPDILAYPVIKSASILALGFLSYTVIQQGKLLPAYRDYVNKVHKGLETFDPNRVPDSGLLHRQNGLE